MREMTRVMGRKFLLEFRVREGLTQEDQSFVSCIFTKNLTNKTTVTRPN